MTNDKSLSKISGEIFEARDEPWKWWWLTEIYPCPDVKLPSSHLSGPFHSLTLVALSTSVPWKKEKSEGNGDDGTDRPSVTGRDRSLGSFLASLVPRSVPFSEQLTNGLGEWASEWVTDLLTRLDCLTNWLFDWVTIIQLTNCLTNWQAQ